MKREEWEKKLSINRKETKKNNEIENKSMIKKLNSKPIEMKIKKIYNTKSGQKNLFKNKKIRKLFQN